MWTDQANRHITHSHKHEPKADGWSRLKIRFKNERAPYVLRGGDEKARETFVKNLHPGDVIGVYCGDLEATKEQDSGTDTDGNRYWLAMCVARSKQSEAVLYQWDKPGNKGWRIAKGNPVLNIIWLERKRTSNHLVFKPGKPQTILMRQVLPLKAIWEKQTGSEMVLSQNQHEDFEDLCDLVREVRGWGAGGASDAKTVRGWELPSAAVSDMLLRHARPARS